MLTKQQIVEFARCKSSPAYFIENYCLIQHPTHGLVPFKLFDFQFEILNNYQKHQFNITNKARQTGLSTITAAYALWLSLFHKKRETIIISIKDEDAKAFLKKIKTAYYNLPLWLRDTPVQDNVHTLELSSGSIISSVASGSSAARGRTPSLLIIDEAAHISDLLTIWASALPTLSKGGKAIIISTPLGIGGVFYDLWKNAGPDAPLDKKNSFNRIFVHWTQIPEYRGFEDVSGMTFEEIVEKAKTMDWYRVMRPSVDDKKWAQEFEGDFLGSGNTVVNPDILKATKELVSQPKFKFSVDFKEEPNGELWVWEKPVEGNYYIVAADIASGDGNDYSATQVLNLVNGEQVAEYQGKLDLMAYAKFLAKLSAMYNQALLIPEATGLGIGLVQKLVYEIGYENIFQFQNEFTLKKKKRTYGWITSPKTRPLVVQAIQTYFNSGDFVWHSPRLWNELVAFVWKEGGKAEAEVGNWDDLTIAFGIAAQNRLSSTFHFPMPAQQQVHQEEEFPMDEFGEVIMKREQDIDVSNISSDLHIEDGRDGDLAILNWLRS